MDGEKTAPAQPSKLDPEDYYMERGLIVFTEAYHLKRGYCCGSGCRHCPWRATEEAETESGRNG
jgi:hypothetical protein